MIFVFVGLQNDSIKPNHAKKFKKCKQAQNFVWKKLSILFSRFNVCTFPYFVYCFFSLKFLMFASGPVKGDGDGENFNIGNLPEML